MTGASRLSLAVVSRSSSLRGMLMTFGEALVLVLLAGQHVHELNSFFEQRAPRP
jgi:hypothetical protein